MTVGTTFGTAAASAAAALAWLAAGVRGRPNYELCPKEQWQALAHCDTHKPLEARLAAFVAELSLDEQLSLLGPSEALGNVCDCHTGEVARIGMGSYMWLTETNSDVAGTCLAPGRCATSFVGPLGHAASFNRTSFRAKGRVLSTELRAFRNLGGRRPVGPEERIGLVGFGPNINIARDPRFGRTSETPGEDPFLSGVYGGEVVAGMQEPDADGRPRALAMLKHLAAYSMEEGRAHADLAVSQFDLFDTYLRQFRGAVRIGRPAGAMCSYNAINGKPSCANRFLLRDIFREQWGQPDAIVTSDCGAVSNLRGPPQNASSDAEAAAAAFLAGTDLEMGSTLFAAKAGGLREALRRGLVQPRDITAAVKRLYRALFRVGLFDPFGASEYDKLGLEDINASEARSANYEAALQAPVLLRNDGGALPLNASALRIAVLGPFANATNELYSGYASAAQACSDGSNFPHFTCITSLFAALRAAGAHGARLEPGVPIDGPADAGQVARALKRARTAQVVVLALGIGFQQEAETRDRDHTGLPPGQVAFGRKILALGKPTVVVLFNGNPLSTDWLRAARQAPLAVVEAFNPNRDGAIALADLLLGRANRWGKLPYTIYPADWQHQMPMPSMAMAAAPGRTYRYLQGSPLWPFGFGLSYTTFRQDRCVCGPLGRASVSLHCPVTNTGHREGDEVVQVYHRAGARARATAKAAGHPVPLQSLVAFERLRIPAGGRAWAFFEIDRAAFLLVDADGKSREYEGWHELVITLGSDGGSNAASPALCTYDLTQALQQPT